jgi:cobalamin biosynthesis Mg chelatase CobN
MASLPGRPRGTAALALVLLLMLFALGLLAGTGSARLRTSVQSGTTTADSTTAETSTADSTTAETSTAETTTAETTTAETTTTIELTAGQTTTVNRIGAGAVAVIGEAAASSQQESETQWGWIAFGILAAGVIVFGIVWLVRRPERT